MWQLSLSHFRKRVPVSFAVNVNITKRTTFRTYLGTLWRSSLAETSLRTPKDQLFLLPRRLACNAIDCSKLSIDSSVLSLISMLSCATIWRYKCFDLKEGTSADLCTFVIVGCVTHSLCMFDSGSFPETWHHRLALMPHANVSQLPSFSRHILPVRISASGRDVTTAFLWSHCACTGFSNGHNFTADVISFVLFIKIQRHAAERIALYMRLYWYATFHCTG